MSAYDKVQITKNYRQFTRSTDNRRTDSKKRAKLEKSMRLYGYLKSFPIVCMRIGNLLVVKDGQHRLAVAETLGLPVAWIEEAVDFDIAVVNSTAKTWVPRDYAEKHAANGLPHYQEGLTFADAHRLPVATAFALLAGTAGVGNIHASLMDGTFQVKDRAWADAVASIYGPLTMLSPKTRNARFIEACMAVCRVEGFDRKRLLKSADRCRDKLVAYSTRDAYLEMLEDIYNFGQTKLIGLRADAKMAMRERNATAMAERKKAMKAAS